MDWKVVECFSLSVSLSLCVSLSPSIYRATFLAIYLSTCLFMYLSIDLLFTYLLNCLSFCLSSHSSIHLLLSVSFLFRPFLRRSISTAIHHHVLRSVSLSIHPCICPSTSSSSYPSIYLATHAFIWSSTLLASICRSIYLSIDRSVSLSSHPSFDLSLDDFSMYLYGSCDASICLSIDLFTRLSIDLAIPLHLSPVVLQNRCLQELPLRYFPSSAYGCTNRCRRQNGCKTQTLHGWVRKKSLWTYTGGGPASHFIDKPFYRHKMVFTIKWLDTAYKMSGPNPNENTIFWGGLTPEHLEITYKISIKWLVPFTNGQGASQQISASHLESNHFAIPSFWFCHSFILFPMPPSANPGLSMGYFGTAWATCMISKCCHYKMAGRNLSTHHKIGDWANICHPFAFLDASPGPLKRQGWHQGMQKDGRCWLNHQFYGGLKGSGQPFYSGSTWKSYK